MASVSKDSQLGEAHRICGCPHTKGEVSPRQYVLEGRTVQSPRARSGASPYHLSESVSAASHLHKKALQICVTGNREVFSLKSHFSRLFLTLQNRCWVTPSKLSAA